MLNHTVYKMGRSKMYKNISTKNRTGMAVYTAVGFYMYMKWYDIISQ